MDYIVQDINGNKHTYYLSYEQLKEQFHKFSSMSDSEFFDNVPKILHFVCIVSFLKEIPSSVLLSDNGLLHELIHTLCNVAPEFIVQRHKDIRKSFDLLMKLS